MGVPGLVEEPPCREAGSCGHRPVGPSTMKPSGPDLGVAVEVARQHMEGDDGQEVGPAQGRQVVAERGGWAEGRSVRGRRVDDVDGEVARAPGGVLSEQPRDLARHAGAHDHVVDVGQHRAEDGRQAGRLDLLQHVDADDARVALLGQPDLGEVAAQAELERGPAGRDGEGGVRAVWLAGGAAALEESRCRGPAGPSPATGSAPGPAATVAARVPVLELGRARRRGRCRRRRRARRIARPHGPAATTTPRRPCRPG